MSSLQRLYTERPLLKWVARVGLLAGLVTVCIAWWAAIEYRYGFLIAISIVATVALIAAGIGHLKRRAAPLLAGLIVAGLTAPSGFAFLGNLLTLIAAAVMLAFVVLTAATPAGSADEEPSETLDRESIESAGEGSKEDPGEDSNEDIGEDQDETPEQDSGQAPEDEAPQSVQP